MIESVICNIGLRRKNVSIYMKGFFHLAFAENTPKMILIPCFGNWFDVTGVRPFSQSSLNVSLNPIPPVTFTRITKFAFAASCIH